MCYFTAKCIWQPECGRELTLPKPVAAVRRRDTKERDEKAESRREGEEEAEMLTILVKTIVNTNNNTLAKKHRQYQYFLTTNFITYYIQQC